MKFLIIIPVTKVNYETGFSAPLAWLFSKHTDRISGIYSFELTEEHIKSFNIFIIELNWYVELYEFTLIVDFIKKRNKEAKILFGGLFASMFYRKIFKNFDVDYYIKGDNELPLEMFLTGKSPKEIPNFIGRDFEQEITYTFKGEDFKDLEFNLDWFPSYFKYIGNNPFPARDVRGYYLPMIITSKGGCTVPHEGCDYCMGSRHKELMEIYGRKPVIIDNNSLIILIKKIEKKYDIFSIYVTSEFNYDFSGEFFNITAWIEIDCPVTEKEIKNIFKAFREAYLLIPVYEEGIMGDKIIDYKKLLTIEDEKHRIKFAAYSYHTDILKDIPKKNILFNLDTIFAPAWAHWDVYTDFDLAFKNSRTTYEYYRKKGFCVFYES